MLNIFACFWVFSFLLFNDGTSSGFEKRSSVENANEYIDKLLEDTIAENRHKIEPYHPGNITFGFERKVVFITWSGKVELHDVAVSGISTIHRDGDCERSSTGEVSKISVNLGMGVLELNSKARVSFMDYGITVQFTGKVGYALIHLEASRDENEGTPPQIDTFNIYDTKGLEASISGLGPLNYVANSIVPVFLSVFKGFILNKIEEKLHVALDDMIKTSDFPLIE